MVFRNLIWVPYGWFKLCWCAAHVDRYSEKERYELLLPLIKNWENKTEVLWKEQFQKYKDFMKNNNNKFHFW